MLPTLLYDLFMNTITCLEYTHSMGKDRQKAKAIVIYTAVLKVNDIAEQMGYYTVQSLIRYVKKYYRETSMGFWKKEAEKKVLNGLPLLND